MSDVTVRQRQRDGLAGFARDFPEMLRTVLPVCDPDQSNVDQIHLIGGTLSCTGLGSTWN